MDVCPSFMSIIGLNLLWMACRHHIFQVILADAFGGYLGWSSTGLDTLMFKKCDKRSEMNQHKYKECKTPLINVSIKLKELIADHCQINYAKEDYCEFQSLALSAVGLETKYTIRKPSALHRERWMALEVHLLAEDGIAL